MSTLAELVHLREREDHIEFKRAQHNYPFAGGQKSDPKDRRHCVLGYVVALANERGGRLVLGMEDAYPHKVVGSDFATNETGNLEEEIYKRLHIRVRTEELYDEHSNRVLVINVPSRPIGKALRFEGVPLMRVGESLREMDDAEYFSIISEQDPDFSSRVCDGLSIEDLDDNAIEVMRQLISDKRKRNDAMSVPLEHLLRDLQLINADSKLNYAALLLLGKESAISQHLPQANIVIEYRISQSQIRYSARQEYRLPLFIAIDKVWDYINQPASNPLLHVDDLPRILDCPAFNREVVREALINAMIHRSLQMTGDILIKIYPDMLEISNPGGFPYGVNLDNVLTVNSSPRNRLMAEVVEKTGLIERSGQGVDIMFSNCVMEGKPLPDYSNSDDYQVDLRLYGEIPDDAFFLFVRSIVNNKEAFGKMNSFDWIALHYVWARDTESAEKSSLDKLLKNGYIVEDAYFRYTLGPQYILFKPNVRNATNSIDLNHILRVYNVISRNGKAAINELVTAFNGILSTKQVRNLIQAMLNATLLKQQGKARATTYEWVN